MAIVRLVPINTTTIRSAAVVRGGVISFYETDVTRRTDENRTHKRNTRSRTRATFKTETRLTPAYTHMTIEQGMGAKRMIFRSARDLPPRR